MQRKLKERQRVVLLSSAGRLRQYQGSAGAMTETSASREVSFQCIEFESIKWNSSSLDQLNLTFSIFCE